VPADHNGNPVNFNDYREARDPLIDRIGDFCSYCENALPSSIAVEHVQPKKPNPHLELVWDNFLLACDYCNPIKGHADLDLDDYFWPDRDNTSRAFVYEHDEPPKVAPGLNPQQQAVALETIRLTGLDRIPGHPDFSARDRRHIKRKGAWGLALLTLMQYREGRTSALSAALTASSRGFFSIWMVVFRDHPEVRQLLINEFKASKECFNQQTDPVPRPGGRI
jgi:uncharacterized protein (TIGR02646 family)